MPNTMVVEVKFKQILLEAFKTNIYFFIPSKYSLSFLTSLYMLTKHLIRKCCKFIFLLKGICLMEINHSKALIDIVYEIILSIFEKTHA
jgi:hypothetical protein